MESQKKYPALLSFEFFPPRSAAGVATLADTVQQLLALKPNFFSVTFGAGGSTQHETVDTVLHLQRTMSIEIAPHISCVAASKDSILKMLQLYQAQGIRHLVALRGDLPSGMVSRGEFSYASDLVRFIREQTGDYFHIDVAAYPEFHPQALDAINDLQHFKEKIAAGANSAMTQYFYNVDAYIQFVKSCELLDIDLPIVPGIMPITNHTQLARFSDSCGAEIPRWIRKRLMSLGDDKAAIMEFGIDVVTSLCRDLLAAGAPGLHFYTLNNAKASVEIGKRLGLHTH